MEGLLSKIILLLLILNTTALSKDGSFKQRFNGDMDKHKCEDYDCWGKGACLLLNKNGKPNCEVDPKFFKTELSCTKMFGLWCQDTKLIDDSEDFGAMDFPVVDEFVPENEEKTLEEDLETEILVEEANLEEENDDEFFPNPEMEAEILLELEKELENIPEEEGEFVVSENEEEIILEEELEEKILEELEEEAILEEEMEKENQAEILLELEEELENIVPEDEFEDIEFEENEFLPPRPEDIEEEYLRESMLENEEFVREEEDYLRELALQNLENVEEEEFLRELEMMENTQFPVEEFYSEMEEDFLPEEEDFFPEPEMEEEDFYPELEGKRPPFPPVMNKMEFLIEAALEHLFEELGERAEFSKALVTLAKFSEDQLMDAIEKYFSKIVGDLDEFLEVLTDFEESIEEEEAKIEEEEARIEEEQANFEEEQAIFEEKQAMIEEEARIEEEQAMNEAEEEAMRLMRERFPFKPKAGFCEGEEDCAPWGFCNMETQRCECFGGFEGPNCERKIRKTPLVGKFRREPRFPRFPFEDEEELEPKYPNFGGRFAFDFEDAEETGPRFPNFPGRFPFAFEDEEERAPKGFPTRSRIPPLPTSLDGVDDFVAPCYGSPASCFCRFSEDPDCIRKFMKSRKAFSS